MADCWKIIPYENMLVTAEVSGADLRAILEDDAKVKDSDRTLWPFEVTYDEDRVPRKGEGYDKDFRPLHLGTIRLDAGPATLTLRADAVPGGGVADVRRLVLVPAGRR